MSREYSSAWDARTTSSNDYITVQHNDSGYRAVIRVAQWPAYRDSGEWFKVKGQTKPANCVWSH